MSINNKLHFRTPVKFLKTQSIQDSLTESLDGYLTLGTKRAFVLPSVSSEEKMNIREFYISSYHQTAKKRIFFTSLKIASYTTIVIPVLALLAKATLRNSYIFHQTDPDITSPFDNESPFFQSGTSDDNTVYAFGDIHGELDGFKENLKQANLIDSTGKWKKEEKIMAIQVGDIIDRGPQSLEAYNFLSKLQFQAKKKGGKLVRLLGNHELEILKGYFTDTNISNPSELASKMKQEILEGKLQLAFATKKRLFIHAGLRSAMRNILVEEISKKPSIEEREKITIKHLANHLNDILVKAVQSSDFSHPIFQIGESRGGKHEIGGVLWEDFSAMTNSTHARDVPQVIGHTPPTHRGDPPIRTDCSKRLITIDAGLCKEYGGQNAFIKFHKNNIYIYEKKKRILKRKIQIQWSVKKRIDLLYV